MKQPRSRVPEGPRLESTKSFWKRHRSLKFLLVMLPMIVIWFMLTVYPNLEIYYLAFMKWNGIGTEKTPVGWQNFKVIFASPRFKAELSNTLWYVFFLFAVQTVVSMVLAQALRRNTRHNRGFRTFFFLPLVFSSVMVGLTWGYMFAPGIGMLDGILVKLGFESMANFSWLGGSTRAIFFIVLVHIWANIGYPITILLSGMQTIPDSLYESATVEGANGWQTFWKITFPLLLPTVLRLTMLTISSGALAFDYVLLLGTGESATIFDTWAVSIYKSLRTANLGIPAAKGVMLSLVLFAVFAIQYFITKKAEKITEE